MPKWDDEDEVDSPAQAAGTNPPPAQPEPRPFEQPVSFIERPIPIQEPPPPQYEYRPPAGDGSRVIVESTASRARQEQFIDQSTRIGILGGRQVGKSYYFQALVQTLIHSAASGSGGSGVLSRYLRGRPPEVWHSLTSNDEKPALIDTSVLAAEYRGWRRLPTTTRNAQRWYQLVMTFGTGLTGQKNWKLAVDFLDGSGELLEVGLAVEAMAAIWERAYRKATIMVFCLPLWVLFPDRRVMRPEDVKERDRILAIFGNLVNTYKEVRDHKLNVQTFLALTMADDRRGSLEALRRRWIEPCTGNRRRLQLEKLGSLQGVPQYLASARQVSNYLYKEIRYSEDTRVQEVPGKLTFGNPPWLVPVSAIDGEKLAAIEAERRAGTLDGVYDEPRPAHVELPLLAAMCECQNALM
jgi:hypothetical protein